MGKSTDNTGGSESEEPSYITDPEHSGLLKTLEFYQDIITRMAENSRHCKTWSVTLVTAVLLWSYRTGDYRLILSGLIPALLLWFLDSYYLHQERLFRDAHNEIVSDFHKGKLHSTRLLSIRPGFLNPFKKKIQADAVPFSVWMLFFWIIWPLRGLRWFLNKAAHTLMCLAGRKEESKGPWAQATYAFDRMIDSPSTLPYYGLLIFLLLFGGTYQYWATKIGEIVNLVIRFFSDFSIPCF